MSLKKGLGDVNIDLLLERVGLVVVQSVLHPQHRHHLNAGLHRIGGHLEVNAFGRREFGQSGAAYAQPQDALGGSVLVIEVQTGLHVFIALKEETDEEE